MKEACDLLGQPPYPADQDERYDIIDRVDEEQPDLFDQLDERYYALEGAVDMDD